MPDLLESNHRKIPRKGYKLVKWLFGKYIEIPEKWKMLTLDNLNVNSTSGGTPSRKIKEYYDGNILWLKSGELKDNFIIDTEEKITIDALKNSSAKYFPPKTVLIALYGATIGKTGILSKKASTNQAICAILPNQIFDEYFLQQFLIRNRYILVTFGMGAGQSNISQDVIRKFKYFIPPSQEQKQIASILSGVDALIECTGNVIEKSERLKKALMQELLTRGIGHTKFKKVKGLFGKDEEMPEEWKLDKIQNYAKITTGNKDTQNKINDGKYPFFIRSQKIQKIDSYAYNGEAVLTPGDGKIGEIFHYVNGKFDFHQRVYKISGFDNCLDGYFFYLYFSTFFLNRAKSMTAKNTVDSIRMNMISEMNIKIPPLPEQQKIASILSGVDAYIQKNQEYK